MNIFFFRAEKPTVSASLDLRSKKIRRDCWTWQTWKNLISDFPERLKIRQRFFFVGEMLVNMKGVKLSQGRSSVHLLLGIKWCHKNCVEIAFCWWERVSLWCSTFIFKETSGTWQFFVAFFGMFKCSFKGSCDLQLGNQKVILNHRISLNCRSLFFFQSQHACPAFL